MSLGEVRRGWFYEEELDLLNEKDTQLAEEMLCGVLSQKQF